MSTPNYQSRRQTLLTAMDTYPSAHGRAPMMVLTSWPVSRRNGDVDYSYRPDSNLFYFTGLNEERSALVLIPGRGEGESILFVRERDPLMETWHGRRVGTEAAKERFGVDEVHNIDAFEKKLAELMRNRDVVFANLERDASIIIKSSNLAASRCRRSGRSPNTYVNASEVISPMRLLKDEFEIDALRKAAAASVAGHRAATLLGKEGVNERSLEAKLIATYLDAGAARHGYPPIVAAGENALILHYVENDAALKKDDLVLIDSGAEVSLYTADITRTFPVNNTYSPAQAEIYDIVCRSNEEAIAICKPGADLVAVDEKARRVLAEGLLALGLMKGSVDEIITRVPQEGAPVGARGKCPLDRFYMHGTSHWLGSDVHDVGAYHDGKTPTALQPGMVFTVEPGLYIGLDDHTVPERYRGIGVRLEDNILITQEGHENLTADLEKKRDDVEALCRQRQLSS